ncbi:hypothetical protein DY000_02040619 [Brassica cretica]|uniref:Uncharacterized protein n=1 Tax=Brassica cretica TaxID=69181 RepID=A0ABQ7BBK7_BRACR|nr:hypothetical protein DY000_02040619 [Brassica cretica]
MVHRLTGDWPRLQNLRSETSVLILFGGRLHPEWRRGGFVGAWSSFWLSPARFYLGSVSAWGGGVSSHPSLLCLGV